MSKPTTDDIIYLKYALYKAVKTDDKLDIGRLNRIIQEYNKNKENAEKWDAMPVKYIDKLKKDEAIVQRLKKHKLDLQMLIQLNKTTKQLKPHVLAAIEDSYDNIVKILEVKDG